jgi:hypothetical protein
MDTFWEEIVIMSCKLHHLPTLRILNKSCLSICDNILNIHKIRLIKKVFKKWKHVSHKKVNINSWVRKIVHPDERIILPFNG